MPRGVSGLRVRILAFPGSALVLAFIRVVRNVAAIAASMALAGCATLGSAPKPLTGYQPETFEASTHVRYYGASPERTCEAARRALLSQGYVVTATQADLVSARKYFQPDRDHHVQLEFRVVCVPEGEGAHASMAFISGLKDQYVARRVKDSASVGVGGLGSFSLPLEGGMDSMVKVASETITEAEVYDRLFDLLGDYLGRIGPISASAGADPARRH